jgi:RsfA family transcription factor
MKTAAVKSQKWTKEEEKVLTNTVLQFLNDGKTQKEAFEEAAQSIGRTAGACGFRWNNKLRKNLQIETEKEPSDTSFERELTLEDCICFLKNYNVEEEILKENKRLKAEQADLNTKLQNAQDVFISLKNNYKQLLDTVKAVPELNLKIQE